MGWIYLFLVIVTNVMAVVSFKLYSLQANSFFFYLGYALTGICYFCLSLSIKHLGMTLPYVVWSGAAIVLVAILGFVFFDESMSAMKIIFASLILVGVVGMVVSE
ncbi:MULTISPECIES: SMR family transporter [unclassified Paenibacillus]|jgi:small multidrug resistance pump|uniref:DMT family transporter n=1 Tax=unclassified Paenibacillus TaxID=185978 RepID=UPI002405671D|nr:MULTISPECIES: SMR family transporter [unclassified Paenibacillus]MDF9841739.1 small multidrug resistance pump [Paenibacillus sp. PastF-2]MDF9848149.1 small multidrug resistance pump [Paenibacillus sp. PastM-2]MDF9854898.1 small multidrug resistance pump [Paenibacillus sp. PastF-1]MDH6480168.1 small multidrug resistance pump [Paenibacillus sp. PastH-2]MDH6507598.1 small multidrug resistance pump [Paenibacillus sp. PastM-3]